MLPTFMLTVSEFSFVFCSVRPGVRTEEERERHWLAKRCMLGIRKGIERYAPFALTLVSVETSRVNTT
jgi:hypothetical protein